VFKLLVGGRSEMRCSTSSFVEMQAAKLDDPWSDLVAFGQRNKFWHSHQSSGPTKSKFLE